MNGEGISRMSLEAIAFTMVGENSLAPYMSGPQIVSFFTEYGFGNDYSNFGTRRFEALERLETLVGTDSFVRAVEAAFDPRRFLGTGLPADAAVEHVNQYLLYDGLELVKDGMYYRLRPVPEAIPGELGPLLDAEVPTFAPDEVLSKMERAVEQFRKPGSTLDDRREAVRNLADVLEYLRPEAKKALLNKDEGDLFALANSFGIRHHKQDQKTEYEPAIWLSWMFYYYLATIHALLRLIERPKPEGEATE